MTAENGKSTWEELLYILFFSLMFFAKGIGLYDGQLPYKLVLILALGCIALKLCITQYSLKEWAIIGSIMIWTALVYMVSKEKGIVLCVLTVMGMKGVSLKRVFRVGLWTWVISMLATIVFYLNNLPLSGYKVHTKLGLGYLFRWSLGYAHPNILHISYLVLAALVLYYLKERLRGRHFLLLMLGNMLIFLYSVSYTGVLITALYLAVSWYRVWRKEFNRIEYILLGLVLPTCLVLSFMAPLVLPEPVFQAANKIFNNRLILAEYYLVPENISLLGNNLENITSSMLTMDNAYIFSLIIYGIPVFGGIVIGYFCMIHSLIKQKKDWEILMVVFFLIAGITEPFLFNTSFKNLTLLFLGDFLFTVLGQKEAGKKQYTLLKGLNRPLILRSKGIEQIKERLEKGWQRAGKRIILVTLMGSILVTGCYAMTKEMPRGYVVPRVHTDVPEEDTLYLESEADPEYAGMEILGYVDNRTKMQAFQGNIVTMEYIRGCVAAFGMSFLGIGLLGVLVSLRKGSVKRK